MLTDFIILLLVIFLAVTKKDLKSILYIMSKACNINPGAQNTHNINRSAVRAISVYPRRILSSP